MPEVKLLVQISGTRDGQEWPAPGELVEVSDDEAAQLIAGGNAVPADADAAIPAVIETAVAPSADVETATA